MSQLNRAGSRIKKRNSRKRNSYAHYQELFYKCPKRLADAVINNNRAYLEPARQPPETAEVGRLYRDRWGQAGHSNIPIPVSRVSELSVSEMFPPINAEGVAEKISKTRKKTAAGPDGFVREDLMIPGLPAILAKIFNILRYGSFFPSVWKENRTTLIPKINKPSSRIENWRPITIGPIFGRIFSSILDRRIRRGVALNLRHKSFTSENGCKINIDLLSAALSYSKRNRGRILAIVDISKAFDTIPHSALRPCLARKTVPTPVIDSIMNMYKGNHTKIKASGNIGVEVEILKGVKQGDPLSPLLFNLCLEPLLEMIEEETGGINVNEYRKVPVLVFADDVVLLGADEGEAQHQVNVLHDYLGRLGMTVSRDKSQTSRSGDT